MEATAAAQPRPTPTRAYSSNAGLFDCSPFPGLILLPLRLIVGWTYFSAFWRRLVLDNKLLPDEPGYLGEKFNHFLPNALLIKPAIEYFVSHPELLWWKLVAFTVVEAIVGFALMAGLFTRAMGIATSLLALGILLGAGWLGTTCLDEWQIGVLGVGAGLALAFAGGGPWSIDALLARRWGDSGPRWLAWARSIEPRFTPTTIKWVVAAGIAAFGLTLWTNQAFHHGVWGDLHNKSVRPLVEVSQARLAGESLTVQLYRVEGADVYGSFAIGLRVLDQAGETQAEWTAGDLAALPTDAIDNRYVAEVKPGAHSLVLPLGAKADVTLRDSRLKELPPGEYQVELLDVSGASWTAPLHVADKGAREL